MNQFYSSFIHRMNDSYVKYIIPSSSLGRRVASPWILP
jgi:hypothetical protein